MLPRRFALVRHVDYTGVSGVGVVAYGVVFGDGHVALRWSSDHPATSLWNSIDDLMAVHGHGEATSVEWLDQPADLLELRSARTPTGRRARRTVPPPPSDAYAPPPLAGSPPVPVPAPPPASAPAPPAASAPAPPPASAPAPSPTTTPPSPAQTDGAEADEPRASLLTEQPATDSRAQQSRVPPQRRPGRHRRATPQHDTRPTRPIESDRS